MAITFFKFGADVEHIRESAGVGDGFGGYYIFSTVADFLSGAPAEYLQSFGSSHTRLTATRYAGFFQGHWNLSHSLMLGAGVRYEFEQLPSIVRENATNFAPRVGLAFSPSHKWVMRAGFGIFLDKYLLAAVNRVAEWNGVGAVQQIAYGTLAAQIFAAARGGTPAKPFLGIAPSVFTSSRNLATPHSEIASLGVDRQLTNDATISATYLFSRGVKLPRTVNVNLATPVILSTADASALGFAVVPES